MNFLGFSRSMSLKGLVEQFFFLWPTTC